jgi:hypothetical protein
VTVSGSQDERSRLDRPPRESVTSRVRRSFGNVVARYLPSILLIAVALLQIYLAAVRQILTPAKGGGFGLFSTVDKLETRDVRVYVVGETSERPIGLEALWGVLPPAMSLPTDARLRAVARTVLTRRFEQPTVAVRVEVWKRDFDSASGIARRIKLRELTLREDGGGAH